MEREEADGRRRSDVICRVRSRMTEYKISLERKKREVQNEKIGFLRESSIHAMKKKKEGIPEEKKKVLG